VKLAYFPSMATLPKPEVILTHESDLDGFVAGLLLQRLAQKQFDTHVPLESCHYDFWRQRALKERCAWASDFAFEARMDRPNWVVIDHHPTEVPAKNALLFHDIDKSAGKLCYELCQAAGAGSPKLDRLVHLSNIADLFLVDDPDFAIAGDYANLIKTYQFWNLHDLIEGDLERLVDHPLLEVMSVKRRVEDPIGYEWSKNEVVEIAPKIGIVPTVVGNTNLILHRLLGEPLLPYTVLISLFRKGNGLIIASLRSRNGEALEVAGRLQGGGHPNAAGAVLPKSVSQIASAVEYLRKVLCPAPLPNVEPSLENLFEAI
jgi:hypothetical protein